VTIVTGVPGVATLTFRAGSELWQLSVVVGALPAGALGPVVASPVGALVVPMPSLGRFIAPPAGSVGVTLVLLSQPAAANTPVTVSSSNSSVVSVDGAVAIAAGGRSAIVHIVTGAEGTATLTFTAAGEKRVLTIVVGQPGAGDVPPTLAAPVGIQVLPRAIAGSLIAGPTTQQTIGMVLLRTARASDTPVTVTSSNPDVASVLESIVIPAGERSATFTLATGVAGVATLRFDGGGETRDIVVSVGVPPASQTPTIVAPVVGVKSGP
jgi:hypothetical protein